jgi:hypothetical protein
MTTGSRTAEHLQLIAASPVRGHLPRTALDLCPETTMILISGILRVTNLHLRSAILKIISSPRNLLDIVVLRLTGTRQMLRLLSLANPASVPHLFLRPHLCLHRRLHVSLHKFRPTVLVESRLFQGIHL